MSPELSVDDLNAVIHMFGEHQKHEMRAEKRESMRSVLFDLPRRSSLGWHVLYELEAGYLRELLQHTTPEELGRRMRTVGSRPYGLQPFIVMCTYLGARQQRMMDLGLSPGDRFVEERPEDLATVVDFWMRLQCAYRSDDVLVPGQAGATLPILDDDVIADLASLAQPPATERYTAVRRMAATLELYGFMLHGEQRDGIFGHGPYPLGDGRVLYLKEFNDLRNDYLPWAATAVRNPLDHVAVSYVAHDVQVSCDMFGSIRVEPGDPSDRLDGVAVLTRGADGALRALDDDEIVAVQHAAADGQEELFMKAVQWDDAYKILYGAPLFANHLKPFFDLAEHPDADAIGRRLMDDCVAVGERLVPGLLGHPVPSVWGHMGAGDLPLYWPMVV
ncbi:hypothetical protein FSW04_25080 [Baekduia soli]|uniref:Uncharacterized protein n=1 Tax=Baekduia soli TaxID=496014 RepID=A0A5B8UBH5_9ACTN|nr:hypothetical protein [Baekduia soli]QEC50533.1 hypothetical protein FSW04_25080 [Baekduia soli]